MVEVLIGPTVKPRGINSFKDPTTHKKWALVQNMRWDTDSYYARQGTTLYISAPVSGATLVDLIPCSLNGTNYLLGFFLKSSEVRVYSSSNGSAWEEITEIGGYSGSTTGNSRFANDTGTYSVAVVTIPPTVSGSTVTSSREVAVIGNGGPDWNRIWDPSRSVFSTISITGVANNGSGLFRITFGANHNLNTSDTCVISGALGATQLNTNWVVTRVSGTVIDLQSSTYAAGWTSGGSITENARLTIHKKLTLPADAATFTQKATFYRYWQVCSSSGKTYLPTAGSVNQARFDLSNTAYDVYTGANACINWEWNAAGVVEGDIATVYFANAPLALGKGLIMITEDVLSTFGANVAIKHVKIEVNRENTTYDLINTGTNPWAVLWDPSSTNEKQRRYDVSTLTNSITADLPRQQWFFPADHLSAADHLIYHIRITVLANPIQPASTTRVMILALCGAGSFKGSTEFEITYGDNCAQVESAPYTPSSSLTAQLGEIGGPRSTSSDHGAFNIPLSSATYYDYALVAKNASGDVSIEGGLNGQPSSLNLYARYPEGTGLEEKARYLWSYPLYDAADFAAPFIGRGWAMTSGNTSGGVALPTVNYNTATVTDTYSIDYTFRQSLRVAPSAYQINIPRARRLFSKDGRLFAGDIMDDGSTRQRGDVYFSWWDDPFRFQSIATEALSGNRLVASGETIMGFLSASAGAQGVSHIHVITDRWVYPMGGSGSQGNTDPLDSTVLGSLRSAISRGTNSPRTIVEKDGAIHYLDYTGQWIIMGQQGVAEPSRGEIDDKFSSVPYARLDDVGAAVFNSRVYIPYTEAGDTTNDRIVGWNDLVRDWEFDDLPPVNVERICGYRDTATNGSGQLLLLGTQAGDVYKYESGSYDLATNPIACRLKSWGFSSPDPEHPIMLDEVIVEADAQSNTWTFDRLLTSPSGTYRTQVALTDGWVTDGNLDHTKTVAVADNGDELSRNVQLDAYGNMTAGTRIRKMAVKLKMSSAKFAKGY